jgi:hypothetical protein
MGIGAGCLDSGGELRSVSRLPVLVWRKQPVEGYPGQRPEVTVSLQAYQAPVFLLLVSATAGYNLAVVRLS